MQYSHSEIEKKWQKIWKDKNSIKLIEDSNKSPYYILDMFPYPSGSGLHVGHPLGYISTDILSRYKKLKGFNVLHPMGFDSFGLPAEQYAIQTGQHPEITTSNNINRYKQQLDKIGLDYDWDTSIETSDPNYYKWTQWIFCKLFEHWFDNREDKARPISELIDILEKSGNSEVFASCENNTPIITALTWKSYSEKDKSDFLMRYRLAFLANTSVNWCPDLGTVLANEEVVNGFSERGGYPVIRKEMTQWNLRITSYADRLISGLDEIEWPEPVKEMQRNWIGKSLGCSVRFNIEKSDINIEVFTTRIDTIFGVSFIALSPEHPLINKIVKEDRENDVMSYIENTKKKSERSRISDVKIVSGVFTGSFAINQVNGNRIPIWIADYVLPGYGTGAVMGVPSSDYRDYAFAKHFDIPIISIYEGEGTDISKSDFNPKSGTLINSGFLNGLGYQDAYKKMIDFITSNGMGSLDKRYKIRDSVFSRQRYWGEPIPVYYKEGVPHLVPESSLPLKLPKVGSYKPTSDGEPPLSRAIDWTWNGEFPLETSTMPGWAGSSWYYLRYMDPKNIDEPFSSNLVRYWNQVDLYVGGSEHSTGHLLYMRFWSHFLFDLGLIPFKEPVKKLVNQGMIQGVSQKIKIRVYKEGSDYPKSFNDSKVWVLSNEDIDIPERTGDFFESWIHIDISIVDNDYVKIKDLINWRKDYANYGFITKSGYGFIDDLPEESILKTRSEVEKMSKSKYNVVNPDVIIDLYGADSFRLYEMFLGPIEQSKPWNTKGIDGVYRFLKRFWSLFFSDNGIKISNDIPTKDELKILNKTIKKVSEDIESLSFNTCISTLMVCVKELTSLKCNKRSILEPLTIILSPFAPHMSEEIWEQIGKKKSIFEEDWPNFSLEYLSDDLFECPISINGKVKHKINLQINLDKSIVEEIILSNDVVRKLIDGKSIKKVVVVPNKIVNLVI